MVLVLAVFVAAYTPVRAYADTPTFDITVVWDDNDNAAGHRPDGVYVVIYRKNYIDDTKKVWQSEPTGEHYYVDAQAGWHLTVSNRTLNGAKNNYDIDADDLDVVHYDQWGYRRECSGDAQNGFVVTMTYDESIIAAALETGYEVKDYGAYYSFDAWSVEDDGAFGLLSWRYNGAEPTLKTSSIAFIAGCSATIVATLAFVIGFVVRARRRKRGASSEL